MTTIAWLWSDPDLLTDAAVLVFLGIFLTIVLPRGELAREHPHLAIFPMIAGVLVFVVGVAWPSGRPLPAIAHGEYDVVQMKNTGASLFLVASRTDGKNHDHNVYSWWIWEKDGKVGWNLPPGGTTPDIVDGGYRSVQLCVGPRAPFSTFISVCAEKER